MINISVKFFSRGENLGNNLEYSQWPHVTKTKRPVPHIIYIRTSRNQAMRSEFWLIQVGVSFFRRSVGNFGATGETLR